MTRREWRRHIRSLQIRDTPANRMLCKIERGAYRTERRRAKAWRRAFAQATREDLWWGFGPHGFQPENRGHR